jgi:hypothetical protein
LHFRCKRHIATNFLLLNDAIRQARVFHHQRKLRGACTSKLFVCIAILIAAGPRAK